MIFYINKNKRKNLPQSMMTALAASKKQIKQNLLL